MRYWAEQQRVELVGGPHDGELLPVKDGEVPYIIQMPGLPPAYQSVVEDSWDGVVLIHVHLYKRERWSLHLMAERVDKLVHST